MKNTLLVIVFSVFGFLSYSQTDSTDLNLYTTPPILETEMDSIMFGNGMYEDYLFGFTISDTVEFKTIAVEFSTITGQVLYKHTFSLEELQSKNFVDSNWGVILNFGKFETSQNYRVSIAIGNYAGVLEPSISKSY